MSGMSSEIINRIGKMEMRKEKKQKTLFTDQETEAALQLIHLNSSHPTCPINFQTTNYHHHLHEPSMKIVPKSEKFRQVQEMYVNNENKDDDNVDNYKIKKRKSYGTVSCSSCVKFDLENNSDEDAGEAVSNHGKKMKKFRSIFDLYSVTKLL
ncbi:hypothetical protein POM88_043799 [Heracleum sosnowskyi]|uniref:Uncharacterized protein n=1 Tax=Heracleum sosnowskyi TaxID=360622 RepID=A0AAD8M2B7_9APIA|nr:hypothetical protein POM88_043799 [Heracleum sosnowskyi]